MTYQKARRSGRISKEVPILLIGSDAEGRVFSEETKTVVISLRGAGILSRHKLVAEQEYSFSAPSNPIAKRKSEWWAGLTAHIVSLNPMPQSELFRCGVAFLPLR